MGGVQAKNYLDNNIQSTIKSINSVSQHCLTTDHQNIKIDVSNCSGNVVFKGNWKQAAVLEQNCKQSAQVSNSQQANIVNSLAQTAQAISQNLSFNPGSTDAANMIMNSIQLSETIKNEFQQNCNIATNQSFDANISNCPASGGKGGNVYIAPNVSQTVESILNCIQNSSAVNSQIASIKSTISQSASAAQENTLWVIVAFLFVFLLPQIAMVKYGVGNPNPAVSAMGILAIILMFITVLIIAYIFLALVLQIFGVKWWPFNKAPWGQPSSEKPGKKKEGDDIYKLSNNNVEFNLLLPKIIGRYKCGADVGLNSGDQTWTIIRKYLFTDAPSSMTDMEVADKVCQVNQEQYPDLKDLIGPLTPSQCESNCFFPGNSKPEQEAIPGQWNRCMNSANFAIMADNKIDRTSKYVNFLNSDKIVSPSTPGSHCLKMTNCNAYDLDSTSADNFNFYQIVNTRPPGGISSLIKSDKGSLAAISFTI